MKKGGGERRSGSFRLTFRYLGSLLNGRGRWRNVSRPTFKQ